MKDYLFDVKLGYDLSVIEQGRNLGIAVHVMVSGLIQQEIPGEITVIYKQVPDNAAQHQKCQQKGYHNFLNILSDCKLIPI